LLEGYFIHFDFLHQIRLSLLISNPVKLTRLISLMMRGFEALISLILLISAAFYLLASAFPGFAVLYMEECIELDL